ncbi:unnamed protein product, partial [Amoebophrya sp. A25]|eukprot:GSA25T00014011001.1
MLFVCLWWCANERPSIMHHHRHHLEGFRFKCIRIP